MKRTILMGLLILLVFPILAKSPAPQMKIDQVMTQQELRETGVSTLSPAQRQALDQWAESVHS